MTKSGRRWVMVERPAAVLSLKQFELREFALPDLGNGDVFVKIQAHTVEPGARASGITVSGKIVRFCKARTATSKG